MSANTPRQIVGGHWRYRRRSSSSARASVAMSGAPERPRATRAEGAEEPASKVIRAAFEAAFGPEMRGVERVWDSFERLRRGEEFRKDWPELGEQRANSYVEGLRAEPFPDLNAEDGGYAWLLALEAKAARVRDEFGRVALGSDGKSTEKKRKMKKKSRLEKEGNSVWVPAVRDEAIAYGPDWRTLVLQDRGNWDETNTRLFPETRKIISSIDAPSVEVFFAKQSPHTGIALHTDNTNFIQTAHLGLEVPPNGQSYIKAGTQTRYWENGRTLACDTSFMHGTYNDSDMDRYILIVRFWCVGTDVSALVCVCLRYTDTGACTRHSISCVDHAHLA